MSNYYKDVFLTSSFKTFHSADFDLAKHILPVIRKRFINELEDSTSFTNPYYSLPKHLVIKYANDSLIKTYSWSERNGGCCHSSATFAQYKTSLGKIKYIDLEAPVLGGQENL